MKQQKILTYNEISLLICMSKFDTNQKIKMSNKKILRFNDQHLKICTSKHEVQLENKNNEL